MESKQSFSEKSKQSFSEKSEKSNSEINYDYIDQSLLTVENVENILNTISPELYKLSYVTFDYPDVEEILNHKYSIINIKQFFNLKNNRMNEENNKNINVKDIHNSTQDENENDNDLENDIQNDNSLDDSNIGHFILIINNSYNNNEEDTQQNSTCIIYPLYYINCFELENYLKNDCGFKNVVWNYNIIQHGNSSSCGWLCCKIAYDYFVKNKVEVECKEYELINY